MSLRSRLTRRARVTLIGVAAGGVAAAIAVVPSLADSDSSELATVAAQKETDYGPEPEADSKLVTQVSELSTMAMATSTLSADTMINRARTWLTADNGGPVPYSMERTWKDGYRQDCSGYVSMALGLGQPGLNTVGLADSRVTTRLSSVSQLRKGDLLIDYSTTDGDFRHVVIFEKWADTSHSAYWAYEQRGTYGTTHRQLRYGIGSDNYDPFRPVKLSDGGDGGGGGQLPSPGVSWPILQSDSQGADVRSAQQLLTARGYPVEADGIFGPKTRSAVIQFQQSRSLADDGVIGPNTWSKLIQTVQYGSSGQAVKAAQTQLNVYGYGLAVDGAFGSNTKSAAVAFQENHHLQVDGIIGPETWRTLLGTR